MIYLISIFLGFACLANTFLYLLMRLNFNFMKNRIAILERQAEIVKLERWMQL